MAPKTKATPVPVIKLDAQDHEPFNDDPNIPVADLQEAFNAAADPPTLTQAIFQQSQAMNAMVAHLVGSQDPLTDLAASSSTSLSTKGAGRREKLQQLLANRSGDFFLQVCHQALRRIKPLDPLPTSLKDLPRKAIFSKYMEKQGGMAGQRDFALMMWLLCQVADAMVAQDHKGAQELLAVTLVTVEQAALDSGKWDLAYLLSLQEDPPQSIYTSRASSTNPRPKVEIFCTVMPAALGYDGTGVCQGCDSHSTCRDSRSKERRRCIPRAARGRRQSKPKDSVSQEAEERRRQGGPVADSDNQVPGWTSKTYGGGRDEDPNLSSGRYACKVGVDEEEDVLLNTWTSLQSHSFVKWCSSLPRKALNSGTPFGVFLQRTFHITRSRLTAPAKHIFPLPVPKVGVFEPLPPRCSSRRRGKAGFDQAFHVIVMALNFLHADCSFVGLHALEAHPNAAQLVAFANLKGFR